jgi:MFS family permease
MLCDMATEARRLSQTVASYRTVLRNPSLRRVELAYAASISAEWASVVALTVFAYETDGALGVGILGAVRMFPAAVATPFAAVVGDRFRREYVLLALELASALTLAGAAVAFFAGRSTVAVYALAGVLAVLSTLLRPTLSALLPSLATTPEELIASNGVSLTTESLGTLLGPALAGVLVAAVDAGTVFATFAATCLVAAVLLAGVHVEGRIVQPGPAGRPLGEDLLAGFRAVARDPAPRLLVALMGAQTVVRGALNVLIVVTAFRLLHAGAGWVGFITAALGAGGLAGAFASVTLAGRSLARPFGLGLVLWGLPIALLAVWTNNVSALLLVAVVGIGNSLEDVAGLTLLQRLVADDVLARALGVLWGVAMAGVGVGSILRARVAAAARDRRRDGQRCAAPRLPGRRADVRAALRRGEGVRRVEPDPDDGVARHRDHPAGRRRRPLLRRRRWRRRGDARRTARRRPRAGRLLR